MATPSDPPQVPQRDDFIAETLRGKAGFFRVGRTRSGRWWLLDPFDHALFGKAVSGVVENPRRDEELSTEAYLRASIVRLRNWHFNALGTGSAREAGAGLYRVVQLDLKKAGPRIHWMDTDVPDVFDPAWISAARERVRLVCAAETASRELIGYFTDHDLRWAQPDGEGGRTRPGLLQVCLSLEPSHRAYHAAWELVLSGRRGDLGRLGRDWGVKLPNREVVRQWTMAEKALTHPLYRKDEYLFSREFARRYHTVAAALVREYDPHHLILGCRWRGYPGVAVLAEAAYPATDLLSLDLPDYEAWAEEAIALSADYDGPWWLSGVGWHSHPAVEDALPAAAALTLERRLREGSQALQEIVRDPGLVGYEWGAWRQASENGPYFLGLVKADEQPVPEHTDVLRALNAQIERWREDGPPM